MPDLERRRLQRELRLQDIEHAVTELRRIDEAERVEREEAERTFTGQGRKLGAANFCATLGANVANDRLTDAEFRQFVRNTLPIVRYQLKDLPS